MTPKRTLRRPVTDFFTDHIARRGRDAPAVTGDGRLNISTGMTNDRGEI
jgi:hypothetical protein